MTSSGLITGRPRYQRKLVVKPRAHAARARPPRHAMVHVTPRARTDATIRHTVDTPALTYCVSRVTVHTGRVLEGRISRVPSASTRERRRPSDSPQTALAFAPSRLCIRSGFCARRTGQIDLEAVQLQYEELHTSMVHGSDRSASARLTPTNPCAAPAGGCRRGPRTGRRASSVRCAAHP